MSYVNIIFTLRWRTDSMCDYYANTRQGNGTFHNYYKIYMRTSDLNLLWCMSRSDQSGQIDELVHHGLQTQIIGPQVQRHSIVPKDHATQRDTYTH